MREKTERRHFDGQVDGLDWESSKESLMSRTVGKREAPRAAGPEACRVRRPRRAYPEEFKRGAVQMLLDGHSVASVA